MLLRNFRPEQEMGALQLRNFGPEQERGSMLLWNSLSKEGKGTLFLPKLPVRKDFLWSRLGNPEQNGPVQAVSPSRPPKFHVPSPKTLAKCAA